MTRFLTALGILLLLGSSATAQWGYYGGYGVGVGISVAPPLVRYPVPAVSYYAPAVPYAYPTVQAYYAEPVPQVAYYPPAVSYGIGPVIAPAPYAYAPGRYGVRFYPYGQPVRNVIRAVIP